MRILVFLIFLTTLSYSQISQRCPVCPPSLNGVPNGYVLTDSSGKAVWQSPSGGSGDTTFAWSIHGNADTDPSVNFIGTTDNTALVFKVGGIQSGKIDYFDGIANRNTSFGFKALLNNASESNTAIGSRALLNNTTGSANVAIGEVSMSNNITGIYNIAVGVNSLNALTSGNENVCIGDVSFPTLITGSQNVGIGQDIDVETDSTINSIIIGHGAVGGSNQFAISDSVTNLKFKLNGQTAGYGLVTNGTTADWQPFTGTPIKDSIAATGATVSPAINTTHVITSAGAITSATLSFPSGTTGNWIIVVFNKAITTLTNSGTGATTVGLVAPLLGTSKTYVNVGGNWY